MKKLTLIPSVIVILLSLGFVSCKKESADDTASGGTDITYPTSGFLCTKSNYVTTGDARTVMYISTTVGLIVVGYLPGAGRAADEVSINLNSTNTVSIRLKVPLRSGGRDYYFFRTQPNINPPISSFPNNLYLFSWSETKTIETEFVLKRSNADKLKFTLESKAYPGYFLGSGRWKNSNSVIDDSLVFTTKQQEFFFNAN
jgi:hypothetical protein